MSTNALNQVYKTGILAIEQALLTQDANASDTTLHYSIKCMTDTPFVAGQTYILRDDAFAAGADGLPTMERIRVVAVSNTAVAMTDGIGYSCTGTLTVEGYKENGWGGGLINSYTQALNAAVLAPGVEMAIQSTDFNCRFKTLSDAPKIDFDDEASRYATGDEGRDTSLAGARSGDITFTQKMAWAGAVNTMPVWRKLMESLGHVVKRYTTTGIGFLPHTWANEITATIWIIAPENGAFPVTTAYRYCGCHGGNGSSISAGKLGDAFMLTAKYSGAYVGTMDLSVAHARQLTSPETSVPEIFLSNACTVPAVYGRSVIPSTYANAAALFAGESIGNHSRFYTSNGTDTVDGVLATAKGSALAKGDAFIVNADGTSVTYQDGTKQVEISQFNLDFGGQVNPFLDQSTTTGNAYFATTDRDPKFTCNPYHVRKSQDDIDYLVTKQITGKILLQSNISGPYHLTIAIPNAQLLSPALASREGYVNTNRNYRCLRNDTGIGSKEAALPAQVMYEILIGVRS